MYHPLQMVCGLFKHINITVMTVREQQEQSKMEPYAEASRYMNNAENTLRKTRKEDNFYLDRKYVQVACGTAYLGVLVALNKWLQLKGVPDPPKRKHKTIGFYTDNVARLDGKLSMELQAAYSLLHRDGYYDGVQKASTIRDGFDSAYSIIARIKPDVSEEELQQYIEEHTKKKSTLWGQLSSLLSF
ncbi:hypothetical protein FACS1894199_12840 [Bacteroidia bacterium]|nr:hypothetical protein FACS1894199_12840 [Bacteroidia bacterium]